MKSGFMDPIYSFHGLVGVKLNSLDGEFFVTRKCLRQWKPVSPLLFNLVLDAFTILLMKGSAKGLLRGMCSQLCLGCIISLQYTDDTLLLLQNDEKIALNFKWISTLFDFLSVMRINYHKSELIPIGMDEADSKPFLDIFQCTIGASPIKYLGIPLHHDKLTRVDIQPLIDKFLIRISRWRGKLLSQGGRLLLVKACLASIPIYLLSFFKFPKWA